MGDLETYFSYRSSGLDLVGLAVGSVDDLRARGASAADAVELARLHGAYFGPTRFTGKQRQARAAAAAQRHDEATLSLIESYTASVKKELDAWNLRVRLAGTPADRIPKVAKERLKQLRPRRVPEPGVRLTYRRVGPHSLTITDSALRISEMRGTLESINPADLLDAAGRVFLIRRIEAPNLRWRPMWWSPWMSWTRLCGVRVMILSLCSPMVGG